MKNISDNNTGEIGDYWKGYYELHKGTPHTKILEKAINEYSPKEGSALDLGAGSLRDTKFLLDKGFTVTAVDSSPSSAVFAKELDNPKLTMFQDLVGKYDFPENHFAIVNAQGFLFHFEHDRLKRIMDKIHKTLQPGGVLVTEFLGPDDDWNTEGTEKSFLTKEQLEELLTDFEIVYLDEYQRDMVTAAAQISGSSELKHWHKYKVVARKK